jgi:16S rRNA (guanine527-N7)-methyltransferase
VNGLVPERLPELLAVLAAAQRRGWIGPGSLDAAVAHALGFFAGVRPAPTGHVVDLGSGGGLPGLPLALAYPTTTWTLLDAWAARVSGLDGALRALGLDGRARAVHGRAEDLARGPLRGSADAVVARGFGTPASTLECGAPFLRPGGILVVSAAGSAEDWPHRALPEAGLEPAGEWAQGEARYVAFRHVGAMPDRLPRRPAAQRRQPLF